MSVEDDEEEGDNDEQERQVDSKPQELSDVDDVEGEGSESTSDDESDVEPEVDQAEDAATIPLPVTPVKPPKVSPPVPVKVPTIQQQHTPEQTSNDEELADKEATASRKRCHEACNAAVESKKRKLDDTSGQKATAEDDHFLAETWDLTSWPELPEELPRGVKERRAELSKHAKDMRKYVKCIQAGVVLWVLVEDLLDRLESYMEYSHDTMMSRTAAREQMYLDIEKEVTTAMHESLNHTTQVLHKALNEGRKDCQKMRRRFAESFNGVPCEGPR